MVPPGDNLEFMASGFFRDRIKNAPEVLEAIKEVLRKNPKEGSEIISGVMLLEFQIHGNDFVIFFKRQGNSIGFMYLFFKDEHASIESKIADLKMRKKGGQLP